MKLLYGTSGTREQTQVFGLACTSSPGTSTSTRLLFTDVVISCSNDDDLGDSPEVVYTLPLATSGPGNELVNPSTAPAGSSTYNGLPVAFYYGGEDLTCGTASCNKVYFNVAVNSQWLADKDLVCAMSYSASAIDSTDSTVFTTDGKLLDQNGQYPQIKYDSILLSKTTGLIADTTPNCNINTLEMPGSKVRVEYIVGNKYGNSTNFPGFNYAFSEASSCRLDFQRGGPSLLAFRRNRRHRRALSPDRGIAVEGCIGYCPHTAFFHHESVEQLGIQRRSTI